MYIEVGVCNGTVCMCWWFGSFFFEIDFYGVLIVLVFIVILLVVYKVVVIVIYFID